MREGYIIGLLVLVAIAGCGGQGGGTAQDRLLLKAVGDLPAASAQAARSDALCQLASSHLDYMIQQNDISHDNSDDRNKVIFSLGGTKTGEIVANNCGRSSDASAANRCAISWEQSEGHNKLMHQSWDTACYEMKQSSNGCYYCIGLFANGLAK